jgi:hypothetical protein
MYTKVAWVKFVVHALVFENSAKDNIIKNELGLILKTVSLKF